MWVVKKGVVGRKVDYQYEVLLLSVEDTEINQVNMLLATEFLPKTKIKSMSIFTEDICFFSFLDNNSDFYERKKKGYQRGTIISNRTL